MSENQPNETQESATTESSTAPPAGDPNANPNPSTLAPETTPRGLRGSGLRFSESDDVPSWAIGKTADELLEVTSQLYSALQTNSPSPTPSTPTPAPTPMHQNGAIPDVDPNLIYSNPAEYHRQMEARTNAIIEARIGAASNTVTTPLASMAKSQAMTHRPDIWKRYGPEIEATMAGFPAEARANVESWKKVVNYVAGEHVDELARLKAEELMKSSGDSGMISSSSGGPPTIDRKASLSPIRKLFADSHPAVRGFIDDHIDAEKVISHGMKRGYSEEAYAEMLKSRVARRVGV